jgi:hypothetical protein
VDAASEREAQREDRRLDRLDAARASDVGLLDRLRRRAPAPSRSTRPTRRSSCSSRRRDAARADSAVLPRPARGVDLTGRCWCATTWSGCRTRRPWRGRGAAGQDGYAVRRRPTGRAAAVTRPARRC